MRCASGHPYVAYLLDHVMAPLAKLRPRVLASAEGDVLEVGAGTGLNFEVYPDVRGVWAIEPDPHMLRRAQERVRHATVPIHLSADNAQNMPFDDARFDTVVLTWVLCTIPDPEAAVREIHRVLKPGGKVLFIEHTRSPAPITYAAQRALDPLWGLAAGGCHLARDPVGLLQNAGFELQHTHAHGPQWRLVPQTSGTAIRR